METILSGGDRTNGNRGGDRTNGNRGGDHTNENRDIKWHGDDRTDGKCDSKWS